MAKISICQWDVRIYAAVMQCAVGMLRYVIIDFNRLAPSVQKRDILHKLCGREADVWVWQWREGKIAGFCVSLK